MRFLALALLATVSLPSLAQVQDSFIVCKYYLDDAYVRAELDPTPNRFDWGSIIGDTIIVVDSNKWQRSEGGRKISFSERQYYQSCEDEHGNDRYCMRFTNIDTGTLAPTDARELSIERVITVRGVLRQAKVVCKNLVL